VVKKKRRKRAGRGIETVGNTEKYKLFCLIRGALVAFLKNGKRSKKLDLVGETLNLPEGRKV